MGEELAANPLVDKVAFTGSTEVGRRIMQLASGTVKPVTLELGGKSANIVLDDADLDHRRRGRAVGHVLPQRPGVRVGHPCPRVSARSTTSSSACSPSAPARSSSATSMDMNTDLGPLVAPSQVETVERYVKLGRDEVGEPLVGGSRAGPICAAGLDAAAFYLPTIFADVDNSTKIAQEEIFGPVLCVIPFDSDDEAMKIANDSIYGLAGGVQSGNLDRAKDIAGRMRTGTVWINDYHLISPAAPFGGYKQSGIGRELGTHGYNEYRQIKHVHINPGGSRDNYMHFAALSSNI